MADSVPARISVHLLQRRAETDDADFVCQDAVWYQVPCHGPNLGVPIAAAGPVFAPAAAMAPIMGGGPFAAARAADPLFSFSGRGGSGGPMTPASPHGLTLDVSGSGAPPPMTKVPCLPFRLLSPHVRPNGHRAEASELHGFDVICSAGCSGIVLISPADAALRTERMLVTAAVDIGNWAEQQRTNHVDRGPTRTGGFGPRAQRVRTLWQQVCARGLGAVCIHFEHKTMRIIASCTVELEQMQGSCTECNRQPDSLVVSTCSFEGRPHCCQERASFRPYRRPR